MAKHIEESNKSICPNCGIWKCPYCGSNKFYISYNYVHMDTSKVAPKKECAECSGLWPDPDW